jgi:hypothetical protein
MKAKSLPKKVRRLPKKERTVADELRERKEFFEKGYGRWVKFYPNHIGEACLLFNHSSLPFTYERLSKEAQTVFLNANYCSSVTLFNDNSDFPQVLAALDRAIAHAERERT